MSKDVDFLNGFEFIVIPRLEALKGDLFANGATITSVIHGPANTDDSWGHVSEGETLIRCGTGFSTRAKSDYGVVVGRLRQISPQES